MKDRIRVRRLRVAAAVLLATAFSGCKENGELGGEPDAGVEPEAFTGVGAQRDGPGPHEFHDPGCTYYLSSSEGDDSFDGKSAEPRGGTQGPWASLAKINELVQNKELQGQSIQLCLKRGDLFRGEMVQGSNALVVLRNSYGTAEGPIVFQSYGYLDAPRPMLVGSRRLPSDWQRTSLHPNIYQLDLNGFIQEKDWEKNGQTYRQYEVVDQLFLHDQGGQKLLFARYPNFGEGESEVGFAAEREWTAGHSYQVIDEVFPDRAAFRDHGLLVESRIHGRVDWTGASIHHKGITWIMSRNNVVSFDPETKEIVADEVMAVEQNDPGKKGFFLNNHLAALDSPGEWYYDEDARILYAWMPESDSPNDHEIEAALFLANAQAENWESEPSGRVGTGALLLRPAKHVAIRGLAFRYFSGFGIRAAGGHPLGDLVGVTIEDNDFIGIGDLAIRVGSAGDPSEVAIKNNWLRDLGCNGLVVGAPRMEFSNNTLKNVGTLEQLDRRGLSHCGWLTTHETGFGIKLSNRGKGVHVHHNHLHRIGHNGIGLGGETLCEYNLVEYACISKGDCGGIKSWAYDKSASIEENFAAEGVEGSIVRNNMVLNTLGTAEGVSWPGAPLGDGMFIDFGSQGVEFRDNILGNSVSPGMLLQRNSDMLVENNLFYGNATSNGSHLSIKPCCAEDGCLASCPFTVRGNTFFSTERKSLALAVGPPVENLTVDNNAYLNPYTFPFPAYSYNKWGRGPCLIGYHPSEGDPMCYQLADWQAFSGQDSSSWHQDFIWQDRYPSDVLSDNLIGAGTFEDGSEGWNPEERVTSAEHPELGSCVRVEHQDDEIYIAPAATLVPVSAGRQYELRADTAAEVVSMPLRPRISNVDWQGSSLAEDARPHRLPLLNRKQQLGVYFVAKDDQPEVRVRFQTEAKKFWLDNVRVREVETYAVPKGVVLKCDEAPPNWARSVLYVNPTTSVCNVNLQGRHFVDLKQNAVGGSFTLEPFAGAVLLAGPKLGLGKATRDFGEAGSGEQVIQRPVLSSIGSLPLTIESVTIDGQDAADFQLTANGCDGAELAPSSICELEVKFAPSSGGDKRAILTVQSSDADYPSVNVELVGNGR